MHRKDVKVAGVKADLVDSIGTALVMGETRPGPACPSPPPPSTLSAGRDRLVRLAYRFLWNRDDAEDVAQEAMAVAHEQASELRDPDKWWSWTCRIVVRRCHSWSRSRGRRQKHEAQWRLAARAGDVVASPAEARSSRVELTEMVRTLLNELPPRQREVLVLRHLEGMSIEQIAGVLEISPATVRVHAMHGREALRNMIGDRRGELLSD